MAGIEAMLCTIKLSGPKTGHMVSDVFLKQKI